MILSKKNITLGIITILLIVLLIVLYAIVEENNIYHTILNVVIVILIGGLSAYNIHNVYTENSKLQEISNEIDDIFEKYNIRYGGGPDDVSSDRLTNLPPELIAIILEKLDPKSFINVITVNKNLYSYRELISKYFLEKYKVNYNDPHDFIYESSKLFDDISTHTKNVINRIGNRENRTNSFYNDAKRYYDLVYKKKLEIVNDLTMLQKLQFYAKWYDTDVMELEYIYFNNFPEFPNLKELDINTAWRTPYGDFLSHTLILTKIPYLQKLNTLVCYGHEFDTIPLLPNLRILNIAYNKLKTLPLFPNIESIDCSSNYQLDNIPYYPNLRTLNCSNTNISLLPLFPNLKALDCSNTNISSLPLFPNLEILGCGDTRISSLPLFPNLRTLDCSSTNILLLPLFPNLKALDCSNTNISSLPLFPNLRILRCRDNPQLFDIPNYSILEEIDYTNTPLRNVPAAYHSANMPIED